MREKRYIYSKMLGFMEILKLRMAILVINSLATLTLCFVLQQSECGDISPEI